MYNKVETSLKYRKRDNVYKNSTGTCTYNVNDKAAYSYSWWQFVKVIKGKTVFNDYNYSQSTCGHQSAVRSLMRELKHRIDVTIYIKQSLNSSDALNLALEDVYRDLFENEIKNTRRKKPVCTKNYLKKIKVLRSIGAKFSKKQQKELKNKVVENDLERLQANRERNKQIRENKKESTKNLLDSLNSTMPLDRYDTIDEMNKLESI